VTSLFGVPLFCGTAGIGYGSSHQVDRQAPAKERHLTGQRAGAGIQYRFAAAPQALQKSRFPLSQERHWEKYVAFRGILTWWNPTALIIWA